ncbi:hypothetical protein [Burkholderia cenocepacia]|uniref:hypothetical protein n=1 Tax=Burkholderia cenocepacia TaxID=95486 RepID=UPI0012B58B36|nr:hypothetical protein [Burkholderia cenocepacia]MBR8409079.1 hypothetical protein [Burkholderia cenocepacia]MCA8004085.1 hypothetical protein [Burkholderia cenocepacia]MCO8323083.1 hypothetical protein [Burkholderia cenocepacia]MCO8330295.1 hypothetical protein [Burkholderia cenocepacia]MCO8337580.1 hypothetical protein [Burkholderia cenocepacia]
MNHADASFLSTVAKTTIDRTSSIMRPLPLLVVLAASMRNEARTIHFHRIAHASGASGQAGCVSDSTQSFGGKIWRELTNASIFEWESCE